LIFNIFKLSLSLFVGRVALADDARNAFTLDNLAVDTSFFDWRFYFHINSLQSFDYTDL